MEQKQNTTDARMIGRTNYSQLIIPSGGQARTCRENLVNNIATTQTWAVAMSRNDEKQIYQYISSTKSRI